MGHCVSYVEMRAVNTSIAEEVLAKVEKFGTVIPTNIKPGAFVQIATNNSDLNEEALDGKNTTHATTMVIYQNKTFGPDPPPNLVEQRAKRRSLQATGTVYDIEECPVRGRRPVGTDQVGSVNMEWYKDTNDEIRTARNADFIWALLRLCPNRIWRSCHCRSIGQASDSKLGRIQRYSLSRDAHNQQYRLLSNDQWIIQ